MASRLATWISRLLQRELAAFERELALFPDDASVWRVVPGVTNAAGTLVLHCCGNLQHFIGHVLGGTAYVRDRDLEFSRTGLSREVLVEELKTSGAIVQQVLAGITDDQLNATYPEAVGGVSMVTGQFLTHLAAHLAFHLGQAGYVRRAVTGDNRSATPLPLKPLAR